MQFSAKGELGCVKHLASLRVDLNVQDMCGMTPLIWACRNGHVKVARFLVSKGADPRIRDRLNPHLWPKGGDTALEWAIKYHRRAIVAWFVGGGVKLERAEMEKARAFLATRTQEE